MSFGPPRPPFGGPPPPGGPFSNDSKQNDPASSYGAVQAPPFAAPPGMPDDGPPIEMIASQAQKHGVNPDSIVKTMSTLKDAKKSGELPPISPEMQAMISQTIARELNGHLAQQSGGQAPHIPSEVVDRIITRIVSKQREFARKQRESGGSSTQFKIDPDELKFICQDALTDLSNDLDPDTVAILAIQMEELISRSPLMAALNSAGSGAPPMAILAQMGGPPSDIKDLLGDPKFLMILNQLEEKKEMVQKISEIGENIEETRLKVRQALSVGICLHIFIFLAIVVLSLVSLSSEGNGFGISGLVAAVLFIVIYLIVIRSVYRQIEILDNLAILSKLKKISSIDINEIMADIQKDAKEFKDEMTGPKKVEGLLLDIFDGIDFDEILNAVEKMKEAEKYLDNGDKIIRAGVLIFSINYFFVGLIVIIFMALDPKLNSDPADIGLIVIASLLCLIGCNGCICGAIIGAIVKKFLESETVQGYKANLKEFDANVSIFKDQFIIPVKTMVEKVRAGQGLDVRTGQALAKGVAQRIEQGSGAAASTKTDDIGVSLLR